MVTEKLTENDLKLYDTIVEADKYLFIDFFVIGNLPFEKQGYDMHDCEYVKEFRLKFPIYRYAFSDDNTHNDNEWEVNFTGWTDVTDWLKEGD